MLGEAMPPTYSLVLQHMEHMEPGELAQVAVELSQVWTPLTVRREAS